MKPETLFADTNLFLRYLTNDVLEQADAVERLLLRAAAGELRLVTSALVVGEIVWTLESFYGLPKKAVREHVLAILNTPGLEVVEADILLHPAPVLEVCSKLRLPDTASCGVACTLPSALV